jgi:restriction system protein
MARCYRVFLGKGATYADQALKEGWVGTGWLEGINLEDRFKENWKEFNAEFVPIVMETNQIETKVAAGLACGMTWTLGRGLSIGDTVVSSDRNSVFHIGKITSPYKYEKDAPLPHRRMVEWSGKTFTRDDVSEELKKSLSSGNTVSSLDSYAEEMETMVSGAPGNVIVNDVTVENPLSFVLERHLEDFLVSNWAHTDLGKMFDIFEEDGQIVGRQFPTDTGEIDILAQSKDGKELVVIELKRGRVSDVVVGQILRYMGFIQELDESKKVRGIIIGTEDDARFKRALSMVSNIEFYKYEVAFSLVKS